MCACKIAHGIVNGGSLILEKAIDVHVRLHINRVAEHFTESRRIPAASAQMFYLMRMQVADNISKGVAAVGIKCINQLNLFAFFRQLFIHGGMDIIDNCLSKAIAVRDAPAHVKTFPASGIISVRDSFLDGFPFQLRKYDADMQHSSANRRGSVKFFGGREEFHMILLKNFHHICKIQNGAADTVKLVYDDALDFAGTDILHHPFKFRSVGIFAGEAFIRVFYAGFSVGFVSAVRKLAFNGYTVFFFDGLSCI